VSLPAALAEQPDDLLREVHVGDLQAGHFRQPPAGIPETPQQRLVPHVDQVIAVAGLQHPSEVFDLDGIDVTLGDDRRTEHGHRITSDVTLRGEPCEQLLESPVALMSRGRRLGADLVSEIGLDVLGGDRVDVRGHPRPLQEPRQPNRRRPVGLDGHRRKVPRLQVQDPAVDGLIER
jgi:hypothetical protein